MSLRKRPSGFAGLVMSVVSMVFSTIIVALSLGSTAAPAQTVDDVIRRGKIVVGIDPTTPPYATLGPDMSPTGFDIDLAKLMAQALGVSVEFVTVNSATRIPALLDGRVDVIVSILSVTPARAQQIWYSNPYSGESTVLISSRDKKLSEQKDLAGSKVGVVRGSLDDNYLVTMKQSVPTIEISRFDDYSAKLQALLSGQVDVVSGSQQELGTLRQRSDRFESKFAIHTNFFGIGMKKGSSDLLHWTNIFLWSLRNEGALDRLSVKWRNAPLMPLPTY